MGKILLTTMTVLAVFVAIPAFSATTPKIDLPDHPPFLAMITFKAINVGNKAVHFEICRTNPPVKYGSVTYFYLGQPTESTPHEGPAPIGGAVIAPKKEFELSDTYKMGLYRVIFSSGFNGKNEEVKIIKFELKPGVTSVTISSSGEVFFSNSI